MERHLGELKSALFKIEGVVGVGRGGSVDSPRVVVMIAADDMRIRDEVARRVRGMPYEIQVTGKFSALTAER